MNKIFAGLCFCGVAISIIAMLVIIYMTISAVSTFPNKFILIMGLCGILMAGLVATMALKIGIKYISDEN